MLRRWRTPGQRQWRMVSPSAGTSKSVLVTGGTGFIGSYLCQLLIARGWRVILLRHHSVVPGALRGVESVAALEDIPPERRIDAVVNLAGARILGPPWTASRRRLLVESRIGTTNRLVQWMARREQRPEVMVSASAVGYYGVRGDERVDESAPPQPVFQSEICRLWEEAALRSTELGVRCVLPRFGVVLGTDGGALPAFVLPARLGMAAVMGTGRQGFPWIHIEDAVELVLWSLGHDIQGPVNAVAPGLVSQRGFQAALCGVLHRPLWLRVPAWPVRVALGEMSQLLVDGQYVEPVRARQAGFRFAFPELQNALSSLLAR
jgi:uncharacterized protein